MIYGLAETQLFSCYLELFFPVCHGDTKTNNNKNKQAADTE